MKIKRKTVPGKICSGKTPHRRAVAACIFAALLLSACANPQKEGTAALEEGNYEEALTQFQEAAESSDREESAEGYRGLGMAYYESGEYEKALESFQKAVDLGAKETVQLYHLMSVCGMQAWTDGEEDEAAYTSVLEYIQTGLALADSDSGEDAPDAEMLREMKYNEIICYEKLADWENARQKAEEYLSEYPEDEAVQKEAEFLKTR